MGDRGRLGPIGGAELVEDVRGVDARRLAADEQRVGDLLVRPARRDEAKDLQFAFGQPEARRCTARHAGNVVAPHRVHEVEASLPGESVDLGQERRAPRGRRPSRGQRPGHPVRPSEAPGRAGPRTPARNRAYAAGYGRSIASQADAVRDQADAPSCSSTRRASTRQSAVSATFRDGRRSFASSSSGTPSMAATRSTWAAICAARARASSSWTVSRRARAPAAASASARRPVAASWASDGSGGAAAAIRRPSATAARVSVRWPWTAPSSASAATSAARSSVPPAASSAARAAASAAVAAGQVAPGDVEPRPLDPEPDPRRPHRVATETRPQEAVGLVPAPEGEGRLRRDRQEQPAVRPLDARGSACAPSRRRPPRGVRRATDPIEQDGEVAGAEGDPLRAVEVFGDRDPGPEPLDALVDPAEQCQVRTEDPECQRLVGRRADRPGDLDRLLRHRDRLREPPARHAGSRPGGRGSAARAPDGGSRGISRSASSSAAAAAARSPASHRYQRCRSSSPAARLRIGIAIDARDRPSAEIDRRGVLADQHRRLRGPDQDVGPVRVVGRLADAIPEFERPQIVAVRVQPGVASLGIAGSLDRGGQRARLVAGGVPVIREFGRRRGRPGDGAPGRAVGRPRLERRGEPGVVAGAFAGKQLAVDDFPQERVAEDQVRVGRAAGGDEDPAVDHLAERLPDDGRPAAPRPSPAGRRRSGHPPPTATRRISWPSSETAAIRARTTSRSRGGSSPSVVSRVAARTCSA